MNKIEVSFLLLLLLSTSGLLPRQVLVLNVLDGIVEPNKLLLLIPLILHLPPLPLLPLQLPLFLLLIPLLEDLKFLIGFLNQFIKLVNLLIQLIPWLLGLSSQLFRSLLNVTIFTMQVLLELLVDEGFGFNCGSQVLYLYWEGFLWLLEDTALVGQLGFGLFLKIGYLYLWLLRLVHQVLFEFLNTGHVLCDLLLILFWLCHLLLLKLLNLHVQFLLFLHQPSHLILTLQLVCDECLELGCWVVFDKFDWVNNLVLNYSSLRIRAFRYRLTLNESFSRSGFSLNSLQSFFVLSFKIIESFAI